METPQVWGWDGLLVKISLCILPTQGPLVGSLTSQLSYGRMTPTSQGGEDNRYDLSVPGTRAPDAHQ